jgi:phage gp29-like protein
MSDRRNHLPSIAGTTPGIAQIWRQSRWNPLRNCTPQSLARDLDAFDVGWIRNAALLWESLELRDDMAKTVIPKRKKAVSHRPWAIVKLEDSPEADRQKEVVEGFYNHITATDALDLNVRGDFTLLVRQMMDAQFKGYAVHEILWQPGRDLRAELKFVPLYLFENTTGKLRYTGPTGGLGGVDLEPGGWMVTCGDCLMAAISSAWMLKRLSLADWLNFSERFGLPGIHGMTDAAMGTPEWDAFVEALSKFANDWIMASSKGDEIKLIEAGKTGDAPFRPMVDRMDAAIARLVRGGDLSTISRENGVGASLQGDETDILEKDDCKQISSHLNIHLTRQVIAYTFGRQVEPLVYIEIQPTPNQDIQLEMKVDDHLKKMGVPLAVTDVAERYGRTLPGPEERLVGTPAVAAPVTPPQRTASLANETSADEQALREAVIEDLAPLYDALAEVLQAGDDEALRGRLQDMADRWDEITDAVLRGESAESAIARLLGNAFVGGLDLSKLAEAAFTKD